MLPLVYYWTIELYFLVKDTTLPYDNPWKFIIKRIIKRIEKIKTVHNKMEQNKAQYNLDGQTAKISALLSENVGKYKLLTGEDILPGKELEKSCCNQKIWK